MRVDDGGRVSAPDAALAGRAAARRPRAGVRGAIRRRLTAEHLVVLLLGLLVLVVHDVGYLLRQPFWTDEAWVAVTSRFPLSQLPATTSSTPIGWSALLRVFTQSGDQSSRLLPLAFAGIAVLIAYWFARRLGWRQQAAGLLAGLLAGLGVLLVPAMLVRDDLKQYTADACIALLVLALTSRLEREWSRRGLVGLSVAVWGGMLVSHAAAFVGAAAFGSLCAVQLARRAWHRLVTSAVAGVCTAALMLGVYAGFDARAVVPGLTAYWAAYYLPAAGGLHAAITFVTVHFDAVHAYFGLGPVWLALPLVLAGLVTIFRLGRPATAVAIAVLWPEMLAASALKKYPFLEPRTSTFLVAVTVVTAAIGTAGMCSVLRPRLKGAVPAVLAALAVAAFVAAAQPYVRSRMIPTEDVRDQARYVAAHAARSDMILVNLGSNWGFAYYWPVGHPGRRTDSAVLQGYVADFPAQPRIVVARNRDSAGVNAALSQALTLAGQHPCTRIWLVRTHVLAAEEAAWRAALRHRGLSARRAGDHGLTVVQLGGSRCP